jgi:hypothetical protein
MLDLFKIALILGGPGAAPLFRVKGEYAAIYAHGIHGTLHCIAGFA